MPFVSRRAVLAALAMAPAAARAASAPASAPTSAGLLAAIPIGRLDLPWWRRRFEEKNARLRQGAGLLWLGDSITQNWEKDGPQPWARFAPVWDRYYRRWNAVNLGFTGDTTASLLWRLREMATPPAPPRAAVVLIGANNFGRVHWPAEATVAGIASDLGELRRRLPQTRVLLLSVLPSDRGAWVAAQTAQTNRLLQARYGGAAEGVTFHDATSLFSRDGMVDTTKFYDPLLMPPAPALHPTAQAMESLAAAIEPTLARLMG